MKKLHKSNYIRGRGGKGEGEEEANSVVSALGGSLGWSSSEGSSEWTAGGKE